VLLAAGQQGCAGSAAAERASQLVPATPQKLGRQKQVSSSLNWPCSIGLVGSSMAA
jgi:hypothetical protein